jgi:hypothetical protein
VSVSLRAGDPPGPWWIAIQRGFGPLYLERVGFDARLLGGRIERISLLMDGSVSMFGLTCAVDDLQIPYFTAAGDFFTPATGRWTCRTGRVWPNMAGVTLAGGLLKQTGPQGIDALGMLSGGSRFTGSRLRRLRRRVEQGQKFTAFFASAR